MKIKCKYENVTASINKRNGVWNLMIRNSGKQISRCTKESNQRKAQIKAKQMLAEMFGAENDDTIQETTGQSTNEIRTVADMMQSYFNGTYLSNQQVHAPEKIKKHVSTMKGRINHLNDFFESTPIDSLNKNVINNYIDHRRKKATNGTIQVELNALFAAINSELSNSRRYNVIQNCKNHWSLKETIKNERRKVALEYHEFDAIHEKLEDFDHENHTNFSLFVELLYYTGVRWGQMSELKFNMIDYKKDPVTLTFTRENMKTKEKYTHVVPIDEKLADKLYRLHEKNENAEHKREYVFCSGVNPNKIFSRTTFYNAWYDAQEKLGSGYKEKGPKGKDVYKFRPHDLKRTFIMESLDMGYDRSEIKAMTNNTSDTIFDGYVNTRRIGKLVSERRATRQRIIEEENKRLEDLTDRFNSELWTIDKLDEMENVIKKKKQELKQTEELKEIDIDVEI